MANNTMPPITSPSGLTNDEVVSDLILAASWIDNAFTVKQSRAWSAYYEKCRTEVLHRMEGQ